VSFTPGLSTAEAPGENRLEENRLEETWRRYAATHFNPARLRATAAEALVSVLEVLESDESFVIQGWWPDS
jgi:hypothetical protein